MNVNESPSNLLNLCLTAEMMFSVYKCQSFGTKGYGALGFEISANLTPRSLWTLGTRRQN